MEFMDVVKSRFSCHSFKADVTVPLEDLKTMVEAAMYAPNAGAKRPWEFAIVQNKEIIKKIIAPHPAKEAWKNASAAIVVVGKPALQAPMPEEFVWLAGAAAMENIVLCATDLGYASCWSGGYPSPEKAKLLSDLTGIEGVGIGAVLIGKADKASAPTGRWQEEKVTYL